MFKKIMNLLRPIFRKDVERLERQARAMAFREHKCSQYSDLFCVVVPFIEINPRNGISMGCDMMIREGYLHIDEKPNAMKAFQRIRKTTEGQEAIARQAKYRKAFSA